jgi:hypothetical protein
MDTITVCDAGIDGYHYVVCNVWIDTDTCTMTRCVA